MMGRSRQKAPNFTPSERFLFGWLKLFISSSRLAKISVIVKPGTIMKFHRALVTRKYQQLFGSKIKSKPGPKGPTLEIIKAVVELKQRNPRFGCPRIAQTISNTFGIDINKDVVRRILANHYKPGSGNDQGPSWLSFIGHVKDGLWSADLFRCESMTLQSYWVLVVMDQWSRRIIGFGVHRGAVNGPVVCRMFANAITGQSPPGYLSTDNDPLFRFHRWRANLRILEIEEIKTIPYTPISHPFVERLIGTIRREYLDHVPFWTSVDLERKLDDFKNYYNQHRVHSSLSGTSPTEYSDETPKRKLDINEYGWQSHCRGIFQTPSAA